MNLLILQVDAVVLMSSRYRFYTWSTLPENLVSKLECLVSMFCLRNVQNMSKKKRGKYLFAKYLPRISLIFSIFRLFLDRCLCGGKACDWHTEWRT